MSYDLKMIQSAGFTGIVTYSSRGTLAKIPELAKQHNLRVIMGIWNVSPTSGELETAIENSDYADAFCVGHRGLSRRYSWADLNRAVQELTERTRKPVTTTEAAYAYANDPHLSRLGSWLFPDVVMPLREDLADPDTFDVKREVRQLLDLSRSMANLAVAPRRPLVCKMALYPHAGAAGTSLANQKQFFVELYRALRQNEHRFPARVSFVFHSAFDSPWKYQRVFAPWDPFTGLLDQNGSPRPAAREIVWSFGASKLL